MGRGRGGREGGRPVHGYRGTVAANRRENTLSREETVGKKSRLGGREKKEEKKKKRVSTSVHYKRDKRLIFDAGVSKSRRILFPYSPEYSFSFSSSFKFSILEISKRRRKKTIFREWKFILARSLREDIVDVEGEGIEKSSDVDRWWRRGEGTKRSSERGRGGGRRRRRKTLPAHHSTPRREIVPRDGYTERRNNCSIDRSAKYKYNININLVGKSFRLGGGEEGAFDREEDR